MIGGVVRVGRGREGAVVIVGRESDVFLYVLRSEMENKNRREI